MADGKTYRVGVIGAGAIAQHCHLPGYARNANVELAAFADPVKARHAEMSERYPHMKGYKTHQEMLNKERLDVVSICTPNKHHAQQTIDALEVGCDVLCEKPMSTSIVEADRMIAAARKTRKKLMIGFTHRFMEGPARCKEMLEKKQIGKPFMIRVRFAHGGPYPGWAKSDWFYKKEMARGGAMLDMGIHAIDLCLWLLGPIARVDAQAKTLMKKIEVDDNAILMLEFKSGALGYIEVGWTSKPGFTGFEIYGSEGSLVCDYHNGLKLCGGKASAGRDSVLEWRTIDDKPAAGGWDVEIDRWMAVVQGHEKLTMDGRAGRNALEVALAAYKASASGKRVALA
jgi:UDP-N-acetylglucosamine 3-dehydrogenase